MLGSPASFPFPHFPVPFSILFASLFFSLPHFTYINSKSNQAVCLFCLQVIRENEASESINVTIEEVNFKNCGTQDLTLIGGAIYIDGFKHRSGSVIHVINSNFTNCQASYGAAVYRDKCLTARKTRLFTHFGSLSGVRDLLKVQFTNVNVIGSTAFSQGVVHLSDCTARFEDRYDFDKGVDWQFMETN